MTPPALWRRARAAATCPTSTALLHGCGAVVAGMSLLVEDRAGTAPVVFRGPEQLLAWTGDPWTTWGVLFVTAGLAVLILGGRGAARWALVGLSACWAAFGVPAVLVGATEAAGLIWGGWAATLVALGAFRGFLELERDVRDAARRCPLAEDCLRLPLPRESR